MERRLKPEARLHKGPPAGQPNPALREQNQKEQLTVDLGTAIKLPTVQPDRPEDRGVSRGRPDPQEDLRG